MVLIHPVQMISSQLRPGILDDLGLLGALEWQAQDFQKKTGVLFEVQSDIGCSDLSRRCCTELFRIFPETLTNIYRHSGAKRAKVALTGNGESLTLSVTDNGRGVSEQNISAHSSLGFIGMRERVHSLGGVLTISRIPEGGTSIRVVIPWEARETGNDD